VLESLDRDRHLGLSHCIEISNESWFYREDFQRWRQCLDGGPATWNPLSRFSYFQDVFMTFDFERSTGFWEGSDSEGLPDDIYYQIREVLQHHREDHGIIRIKSV
jgi:hypothetical protein